MKFNNFNLKLALALTITSLCNADIMWKAYSGHSCKGGLPTQVMSKLNGVNYAPNTNFDVCAINCATQYWVTPTMNGTSYTECANQCIINAGFTQINTSEAQTLFSTSCSESMITTGT